MYDMAIKIIRDLSGNIHVEYINPTWVKKIFSKYIYPIKKIVCMQLFKLRFSYWLPKSSYM